MSSIVWENAVMQVPELWNFCWRDMPEFKKGELWLGIVLVMLINDAQLAMHYSPQE